MDPIPYFPKYLMVLKLYSFLSPGSCFDMTALKPVCYQRGFEGVSGAKAQDKIKTVI